MLSVLIVGNEIQQQTAEHDGLSVPGQGADMSIIGSPSRAGTSSNTISTDPCANRLRKTSSRRSAPQEGTACPTFEGRITGRPVVLWTAASMRTYVCDIW